MHLTWREGLHMREATVKLSAFGVVGAGLLLDPITPGIVLDARAESFSVKPAAWEMT